MTNKKYRAKTNITVLLLSHAVTFVFAGCAISLEPNPRLAPATLIYMIADNNLDYYAMANIKQMEQGILDDTESNIFVFIDRNIGGTPSHPYAILSAYFKNVQCP